MKDRKVLLCRIAPGYWSARVLDAARWRSEFAESPREGALRELTEETD